MDIANIMTKYAVGSIYIYFRPIVNGWIIAASAIGHRLGKSVLRHPSPWQLLTSDSKNFRRQQQEHPIASIPLPTTPILSSQTIERPQTGL